MTSAKPATAFGQVTVGVDSSRIARSAAAMKTAAPATASFGPRSVPISSEKPPKAARAMAAGRRGLRLDVGHAARLRRLLDLDGLERLDVRAGGARLAAAARAGRGGSARTQKAAKTTTKTRTGSVVDGPAEATAPRGSLSCSAAMRSCCRMSLPSWNSSSQPMNAFPVLSARLTASSGVPATAIRRMMGISESSTRLAVTTEVTPSAVTLPRSSPNSRSR